MTVPLRSVPCGRTEWAEWSRLQGKLIGGSQQAGEAGGSAALRCGALCGAVRCGAVRCAFALRTKGPLGTPQTRLGATFDPTTLQVGDPQPSSAMPHLSNFTVCERRHTNVRTPVPCCAVLCCAVPCRCGLLIALSALPHTHSHTVSDTSAETARCAVAPLHCTPRPHAATEPCACDPHIHTCGRCEWRWCGLRWAS